MRSVTSFIRKNVARMHVEMALAKRKPGDKPLAVVTDMDDTVRPPLNYWGHLKMLGFPYADTTHLTVLRDTSSQETRQDEILKAFGVPVFLGGAT